MHTSEQWSWSGSVGPRGNLREAVALFSSEEELQSAVADLECHGFSNAALSRPKAIDEVEQALDRKVISVHELEDNASVPREAYLDPATRTSWMMALIAVPVYVALLTGVVIAVGNGMPQWQAVAMVVFLGIAGMIWGGYYALRISRSSKHRIRKEQTLGGLLLWVRTGSPRQETLALDILRRHSGRDVHLHGPALH